MTSTVVLQVAARLSKRYAANYAAWQESCEMYAREGYRPHHCEHGFNLWTDYDPICGPCEDGLSMGNGVARRRYALDVATENVAELHKVLAAAQVLKDRHITVGDEMWDHINSLLAL